MSSRQGLVNMTSGYNLRSGSSRGGIPANLAHATRVASVPTPLSGHDVTPKPKAPPKKPATKGKASQKTRKRKRQVTPAAAKKKPETDLAVRASTSALVRGPLPSSWDNWPLGRYPPPRFPHFRPTQPPPSDADDDKTANDAPVQKRAPVSVKEGKGQEPTTRCRSAQVPKKSSQPIRDVTSVTPESDEEESDVEVISIDEELPDVEVVTLDEEDSDETPAPEDADPDANQVADGQHAVGQMSSGSVNRTQMPPKATPKPTGTKVPAPRKRKAPALLDPEAEDPEGGRVLDSETVAKRQVLVKRICYALEDNGWLSLIRPFDKTIDDCIQQLNNTLPKGPTN